MRRFSDWPQRLPKALRWMAAQPFSLGKHDCFLATLGVVERLTGEDLFAPYRRDYGSVRDVLRGFRDNGCRDLQDVLTTLLGKPLDDPRLAQRGDVVLLPTDDGAFDGACGIVDTTGRFAAVFDPKDGGLVHVPVEHAVVAWRV